MIALTPEASAQIDALEQFYIDKQRPQALRNLGHALAKASLIITNAPERGIPAARPYPDLAALGLSWLKRRGVPFPVLKRELRNETPLPGLARPLAPGRPSGQLFALKRPGRGLRHLPC